MDTQTIALAYAKFYEELSPSAPREAYGVFFDKNSEFSDPFQKVKGVLAIEKIFQDILRLLM